MARSTASTLDELRATGVQVDSATEHDTVDGVPARWVARPTGTDQVSVVLRAAAELGLHVVARGTGTRLSWGTPPRELDLVVDTGRMDGVIAHVAGDLVVSVQAGLRMADLQATLAAHGQRLALDGGGSVGGTIATAAAGPLRYRYGSVRDLIIGITVVLADGNITKSGGTVVKNVAGYDLAKLYTGSLGTLGIITEAVFRLHPLPAASRWITVSTDDPHRAAAAVAAVRDSQHDPVALEVDRVVPGGPVTVSIAVEGVTEGIAARADVVAGLLSRKVGTPATITQASPDWWGLPPYAADRPAVVVTSEPTGLGDLLAIGPGSLRGSAGAGVLVAGLHDSDRVARDLAELRAIATRHGGTAVLRCAPLRHKSGLDVWGPVPALALMRRLKNEFDPQHRLAPGRFVGGI